MKLPIERAIIGLCLSVLGTVAWAGEWRTMHAGAFPATHQSAVSQCHFAATMRSDDALTAASCVRFESMLEAGTCDATPVADGRTYSFMGMNRAGYGPIAVGLTKRLNDDTTPALRCDVGGGVIIDWFNEPEVGCNNVGIVVPPVVVDEPVCRLVPTNSQPVVSGRVHRIPTTTVDVGCNCGQDLLVMPGITVDTTSVGRSTHYTEICE